MQPLKIFPLIVLAVLAARGQVGVPHKPGRPFDPKDYPSGKFRISKKDYPFGNITVRVINVKNLGYTMPPEQCRAWVEISQDGHLAKRFYYDDINPVGFSFGAFVPRNQPENYFAVVKEGDYDGRLLLIDHNGGVVDLPGGFYFLTADKKYLVSQYASEAPGLTVYDLANHEIVLEQKNLPQIGAWFRDQEGYFFMEYERPGHAQRLDLKNRQLLKTRVPANDREAATKVDFDFDTRKKQDCLSTPQ